MHESQMPVVTHTLSASILLAVGCGAVSAQPVLTPNAPVRKTTDTLEFCRQLADDVDAARRATPVLDPHVQTLASEGQRMCNQGHIIPGIARLRMALTLLRPER
jgi:hypothetical protein